MSMIWTPLRWRNSPARASSSPSDRSSALFFSHLHFIRHLKSQIALCEPHHLAINGIVQIDSRGWEIGSGDAYASGFQS